MQKLNATVTNISNSSIVYNKRAWLIKNNYSKFYGNRTENSFIEPFFLLFSARMIVFTFIMEIMTLSI